MKAVTSNDRGDIPGLVKLYLDLYEAIPKFNFPGTKLDMGFMSFWMVFFFAIRCVAIPVFVSCGWPDDNRFTFDAAASFVGGYFHAPQVVTLSFLLLASQKPYNPAAASKDDPKWWQNAADATLQLCTAYMVYDFFFLVWTRRVPGQGIVLDSETIMYMLHHFVTTFYMTTSRIYDAGQSSALTCVFMGEFTNTSFNTYFIYDMAQRANLVFSPFYAQFVIPVEVFTAALYLLFRVVLSPLILSYASYTLMVDKGIRAHVPLVMRLIWCLLMGAVLHGSINQNILFCNLIQDRIGYNTSYQEL